MADTAQASAAEASANSREIRVFLSSTFRDFNEERRLLATQVFPRLNRQARERGVELVEVDLRWGVTQEQAEDGHALEICLKEIERCRPYFIGMLGDSYGSLTPPQRQLLQAAPELLEQRQWLDGRIGEASYTELEIEHGLQLLRDPAMAGKAFFYFRDPAYSEPKADAGEAGWRSDTPEDRQKLEQLRQKIRDSRFPCREGLSDPQAVVDQIEKDLWALIDQQFPEGEQPDALQKEACKHADYRRSRTGAGQYIGGEAYIQQLEQWIEAGEQQILITGESGAGKSALIANWIEAHQQTHPADVIYAHHLGCTNDANALRPLLGRLIDTASAQLLDAEVIREPLAVPEDWWELVAKVAETLQTLGRWCEQHGKRWICVLDGLDRLDPDDQTALPWLPQNLSAGVQVVASALACPARSILRERGYSTLTIEPLVAAEQEQLIKRYLQRYTKELDGGLRQQILSHKLAGSPLFLKVLLEELRQCGRHDTLKQQLDFYLSAQTIDDLYERVLGRLENDGSGENVPKVMTAIWASRAGLAETELLAITDLAPLQWAPIDLALEKAFGRNGNRLVFDHDFLRIAVKDRYLPSEEQQRQAHSALADWYGEDREDCVNQDIQELPWQLMHAGRCDDLEEWLLQPLNLALLTDERGSIEAFGYWMALSQDQIQHLDAMINDEVEAEIERLRDETDTLIWFANQISDLLESAGLYRGLLLRLRALIVKLEGESDSRATDLFFNSVIRCASAFRQRGFHAEAENLYRIMIGEKDSLLEEGSPQALQAVNELALTLMERGEREDAEALFRKNLKDGESRLGREHPDSLAYRTNLALILQERELYSEAQEVYLECLDLQRRVLGNKHLLTVRTTANLGMLYHRSGDLFLAKELCETSLEAQKEILGFKHPESILTANYLAIVNADMGDYVAAEELLIRCAQAQEEIFLYNPCMLRTFGNLADLYERLGRSVDVVNARRRDLDSYRTLLGADDANTLSAVNELAISLRETGELDKAETLFRELVASRQQVLEPEDFQIGRALGGLAKTLEEAGKLEESLTYGQQALEHRLTHEGPDAWWTNRERLDLARVLKKLGRLDKAFSLLDQLLMSMKDIIGPDDSDTRLMEEAEALREDLGPSMG